MRPARKGPENPRRRRRCRCGSASFNEAGPQGAGKPRSTAGATTAPAVASMRPARKGPENHGVLRSGYAAIRVPLQ